MALNTNDADELQCLNDFRLSQIARYDPDSQYAALAFQIVLERSLSEAAKEVATFEEGLVDTIETPEETDTAL